MDDSKTLELLDLCEKWVRRYVVLSAEQYAIIASWIPHTWAIDAAECTPYLHVTAPKKGCGKSRLLETLEPVVCHPCKTGGMTPAALVRTLHADKPTLLLDELDAALGNREYSELIRGILNEGFREGGNVRKVEGKDHQLKIFYVFGAKAIAGIGTIPDTVASRSIVIEMRRKTRAESVEPFRQREVRAASRPLLASLRDWASPAVIQALSDARPLLPDELSDRQKDIAEPLVAIADLAGGEWPGKVRCALVTLFQSTFSDSDSVGTMLLFDIRRAFEEMENRGPRLKGMFSADLARTLCRLEGRPWTEWANGQVMNANQLARQLKKYRIYPQSIRMNGLNQKGYLRHAFDDAWTRYCPPSFGGSPDATSVTIPIELSETPVIGRVTRPFGDQVAAPLKPASTQCCDAVTSATALPSIEKHNGQMFEGEI